MPTSPAKQVIRNVPDDDYLALVRALESLERLDYHVEWCLEHIADIGEERQFLFFEQRGEILSAALERDARFHVPLQRAEIRLAAVEPGKHPPARAAQQGGVIADELQRAVGRRVVVDDDLVPDARARRVDRAEAARDPALAVPRHDGDRERCNLG